MNMVEEFTAYMQDCSYHMAYARVWKFINSVNAYFHAQEPWKVVGKDKALFDQILSATAHGLHAIAIVLWRVMPENCRTDTR